MRRYFLNLILALPFLVCAQLPDSLLSTKTENYFSLQYDNDVFNHTDRYYTQGILLTLIHPIVKYSPISYALIRLNKNARNYYGFHLEQDVFTPITIRHQGIFYGERPYAAVLFMSHSLTSIHPQKRLLIRTCVDLGVIGPAAQGAEEQKGIHKAIDNPQPLGWQYQVSNDVIVNYDIKLEKGIYTKKYFEWMGSAATRIGTLYNDLGVGTFVRCGIFSPYFNNLGLENDDSKRKNKFKIYVTARLNVRAVGYNATLQGGLINQSRVYTLSSGTITRGVLDSQGGIVMASKRLSLEYRVVYITSEFRNGVDHSWGSCLLNVCF